LLSAPPITISEGALVPPTPDLESGSGGSNLDTNIQPEQHMTGSISPPRSIPPGSSYLSGGNMINIRARSGRNSNYSNVNRQINNQFDNSRVSVSVSDDRSKLTPDQLNKLMKKY
jgi:hypothetical protein